MTGQDIVTWGRLLIASAGGSAVRWNDTQFLIMADRAVKHVISKVKFPESRLTRNAVANQQEYPLPALHVIKHVYINGQLIVPADVDTLEGNQIQRYDQTGQGVVPAGGGGAQGGTQMQPQWAVQTPTSYPFLNSWGIPGPIAQPYSPGQRARFYLRGGSIGFVPMPNSATAIITIDCVRIPTTLSTLGQEVVVPDNFMDATGWKIAQYAFMSNNDDRAADQRNFATQAYTDEVKGLWTWMRQFGLEDVGPFIETNRGYYRFGAHRTGDNGWGD